MITHTKSAGVTEFEYLEEENMIAAHYAVFEHFVLRRKRK